MASHHYVKNSSYWTDTVSMPRFSSLNQDIDVDVCVIGGGIAGISTAYLLIKEGKRVCLLESYELCSGQTSRTTAHFSTALDDRYFTLEKYHGRDGARLAADSHFKASKKVRDIIDEENIECDSEMLDGYLFSAGDPRDSILEIELEAAHRIGLLDVTYLDQSPLDFFNSGPCLLFPNQMKLNPLKYLKGLVYSYVKAGGHIFTQTPVVKVKGGDDAFVGTKSGFKIRCQSIVVATNSPINDLVVIHTKQAAYRSYVMGYKIPKDSIKNALYWDTLEQYHYISVEKMNELYDVLIVGGEDHKTGQVENTDSHFENLDFWIRHRFPMVLELAYKWSGQVMEPVDGLAFLGRNPMDEKNVFVITGDSGNGMTHCTIGAILVTDQIMNRKNPWEALYDPGRISFRSATNFLKENTNVAAQYTEWLELKASPDFDAFDVIEGVVYRQGLKLLGAYKNDEDEIKFISVACSHLGGVVHWNNVEKSWDCPCHGSRFDSSGKVIEGPALSDLEQVELSNDRIEYIPLNHQKQKDLFSVSLH
jgi:glycine/D-amino acid oxidase-like deaminating enzyme/Rieske Fe-S protein